MESLISLTQRGKPHSMANHDPALNTATLPQHLHVLGYPSLLHTS